MCKFTCYIWGHNTIDLSPIGCAIVRWCGCAYFGFRKKKFKSMERSHSPHQHNQHQLFTLCGGTSIFAMNDRLSAMLLILRRRRRRKALSKINLAVDLLLLDLATRPGRGHMRLATLPRTPFYFNLNESHEEYIMRIINHPIKHGIRGDNFRATKYSPKSRLFNVLTFLHANYTCRFGELFTKWSKSSLNRDLHHCCAVLHTVVSTMCQMSYVFWWETRWWECVASASTT